MESIWLWLAIAGAGALHGLNPAGGWALAAAWGIRSGRRPQPLRALVPIGAGHLASVALVSGAAFAGLSIHRGAMPFVAGALCALALAIHLCGRAPEQARAPAGHAGLALWSFMIASLHGAGLMLVPALIPLCMGDAASELPAASGMLTMALAAAAIHTIAMLAVTGLMATATCAGFRRFRRTDTA